MPFSVLFDPKTDTPDHCADVAPPSFIDLNLDQIVDDVTAGLDEYDLKPFFYTPLTDESAIDYRHEVLGDLANSEILRAVRDFAEAMRQSRTELAEADKRHYALQAQAWFLDSARTYCTAVDVFSGALADLPVKSTALTGLRRYLMTYRGSEGFESLEIAARELNDDLAATKYSVHLHGNRVRVGPYDGEPDYSSDVHETFAKFEQGDVKSHLMRFPDEAEMNHVEAQILQSVAQLNPQTFTALDDFRTEHLGYPDDTVVRFDREIEFYIGFLDYVQPLGADGLSLCVPEVKTHATHIAATDTFDLALARKSTAVTPIVMNSFELSSPERILVVSGPNQGGKTTFARTFGQLHWLACLGLPVPGTTAVLALFDNLFTHFEREEQLSSLHGKLEDELVRIHDILADSGADSIVILNEIFTSTTLDDALDLGTKILSQLIDKFALCVYVTFVDELSRLGPATVSMVSQVVPDDPAHRTFKLARKRADGLAYAAAIAEKYGLSYDRLKERIPS